MLRANKKTLIITSIITVLPIFAGLLFWNRLPDVMATHFGTDNVADGFSSKAFAVFGLPLFCLAIQWVMAFFTFHDPRRQNISQKIFSLVLWIVPVVSLVCAAIMYPYNLGYQMDISFLAGLFLGLMFVVLGNFMPKTRHNYTIGIKVPWTLANEENWDRTHRFAGFLWVIGGILMIILALTGIFATGLLVGLMVILTVVPTVYSFWLHAAKGM